MSHCTTIETEIKDFGILRKSLERLGIKYDENYTSVQHYTRETQTGLRVVGKCGDILFQDNGKIWCQEAGSQAESLLGDIKQMYSVLTVKKMAQRKGYTVSETVLENGEIKLRVAM